MTGHGHGMGQREGENQGSADGDSLGQKLTINLHSKAVIWARRDFKAGVRFQHFCNLRWQSFPAK